MKTQRRNIMEKLMKLGVLSAVLLLLTYSSAFAAADGASSLEDPSPACQAVGEALANGTLILDPAWPQIEGKFTAAQDGVDYDDGGFTAYRHINIHAKLESGSKKNHDEQERLITTWVGGPNETRTASLLPLDLNLCEITSAELEQIMQLSMCNTGAMRFGLTGYAVVTNVKIQETVRSLDPDTTSCGSANDMISGKVALTVVPADWNAGGE